MKTKNMLLLLAGILLTLSSVNAEYRIYTTQSEFEEAKGAICEAATDGCNNYMMSDGKVTAGTKKMCFNHTPEWTCTKFKEGSITTLSMPITTTAIPVTTTAIEAVTTNIDIVTTNATLSDNDMRLYETILDRLDSKYVSVVEKAVTRYEAKFNKYDSKRKTIIMDRLVEKIDEKLFELTMSVPQDSKMTEKQTIKYYVLTLLKFKLVYGV